MLKRKFPYVDKALWPLKSISPRAYCQNFTVFYDLYGVPHSISLKSHMKQSPL